MANGAALRHGRWSEPGRVYLITTVTINRAPWFSDFHRGRLVVGALRREAWRAETLAFVVMPDHLHWLLQLNAGSLSLVVSNVKSSTAYAINTHLSRKGRIWQRGFHDHAVRRDEDLRTVARYIIANPIRAGLAQSIRDYSLWDACWLKDGLNKTEFRID